MLYSRGLGLFLAAAAILGVSAQPMRPVRVTGSSMSPTYANGSVLWTMPADRPLQHGDVVIADTPEGRVIKRVALLPGDVRVQWRSSGGWSDLTDLELPRTAYSRRRLRGLAIPPGTVFLLGDNLEVSLDSRSFGPIPIAQVRRLVIDQRSPDEQAQIERSIPRRWLASGTRPEVASLSRRHWRPIESAEVGVQRVASNPTSFDSDDSTHPTNL